jgi:ATP-dependent DNA helicase DinG
MSEQSKDVERVFSQHGTLSSRPDYEYRPQQLEMARAISSALERNSDLIVEAPTGVGKSLAYLVPAIVHAVTAKRKAVVSTHTKNLQEQLINNDVEIARSVLDLDFDAVVLKGRRNYLCTTRLRNALNSQHHLFEQNVSGDLRKLESWSLKTADGDLENLPFTISEEVRQHVCSEKGACSQALCGSKCFFQKAKHRAREAPLVILNHSLFFTLLALQSSEEQYLYPNDFIIFDEAHMLEQVAGVGIGKSISRAQVLYALHRLYNSKTKRGLFASLKKKQYGELFDHTEQSAIAFFENISSAARALKTSSNSLRIRTPNFVSNSVRQPLIDLQHLVKELGDEKRAKVNKEELAAVQRLLWEAEILIGEFLEQPNPALTYWIESGSGRSSNVTLHTAPTDIAESLGSRLFRENSSVVMTSATLSMNGSLDYFRHRLGARKATGLILGTPFDFYKQMRLVLVRELPPPDDPAFEEDLPDWIHRSIARTKGKALVLFTSSALLRKTAASLRERLEQDGITLLVQEPGESRTALLQQFQKDIHSVLFGLDSFWMGIDVPGEALEHVIITRLPFAVPDHPLVESRMELIAQRNGNSFFDYQLPEAVLKLRQGVGRLIRTKTDHGMVTILDSRILNKQYGQLFLRSLPHCRVEILERNGETTELETEN